MAGMAYREVSDVLSDVAATCQKAVDNNAPTALLVLQLANVVTDFLEGQSDTLAYMYDRKLMAKLEAADRL